MSRSHIVSASAALQTLRQNPLHSILSTLGIIIGVAALVAILSLAEGMEEVGREQISRTTDLQYMLISPLETETVDGIVVRRPTIPRFSVDDASAVRGLIGDAGSAALVEISGKRVRLRGDSTPSVAFLYATEPGILEVADARLVYGRMLTGEDVEQRRRVAVVTDSLASHLTSDASALVGDTLLVDDIPIEIVGVVAQNGPPRPAVFVPSGSDTTFARSPVLAVRARTIEDVPPIRTEIEGWLDERFEEGSEAFHVATNEFRVEQVRRGVLLFKLVMGLITGISVIVGGIGVMNVLLVSITERTREIGIRRSSGARRSDIVLQFLAESTALSFTGCALGLVLGFVGIMLLVPAIRYATEVPFRAAFDWSAVVVVAAAALVVGLVFGTYPAYRASRLDPIDALRHE